MGNSLGLVIDKPILRMLGLGYDSVVKLTTDGRRLVIERADKPADATRSADPRLALDASTVMSTLLRTHGMSQEQFQQLHHARWRFGAYLGWLEYVQPEKLTEADLETMRRLEVCLAERTRGAVWADAMDSALAAHPLPRVQRDGASRA